MTGLSKRTLLRFVFPSLLLFALALPAVQAQGTLYVIPPGTSSEPQLFLESVRAQDTAYMIPPDPAGMDAGQVIGAAADEAITLGEFRERVRFERWRFFNSINRLVGQAGPQVLDFADENNRFRDTLANIAILLGDEDAFGGLIYEFMLRESFYRQEAQQRGLATAECDLLNAWATTVFLQESADCQFSEAFDTVRGSFINRAVEFSNIAPAALEETVAAQLQTEAVRGQVAADFSAPAVALIQSRHIRISDAAQAQAAMERIAAGEDFGAVLVEMTEDQDIGGNGGDLGFYGPGGLMPALDEALFSGEAEIGALLGPVETARGFHIVEALDSAPQVRARHILVRSEAEAMAVLERLAAGETFGDLARELSLDSVSASRSGDLGFIQPGQTVAPFEQAVFEAPVGEPVGPVETQFGFHIIEVTARDEENAVLHVRHIVLATEAEALDVKAQLEAGADFASLARAVSIDPTARGGDTLFIASQGQQSGFYEPGALLPELGALAQDAAAGDILGPLETQIGYLIFEITGVDSRPATPEEAREALDDFLDAWEAGQLAAEGLVQRTDLWRGFVPNDPLPSDLSAALAPLDELIALAAGQAGD